MSFKLGKNERRWLKDHEKELPHFIDRSPRRIAPGRRDNVWFRERKPPRVGGVRVEIHSFSELDWETEDGERIAFEENLDWDFVTEFNRFRGADEELLFDDELEDWFSARFEASLYFWSQECRVLRSRLKYFESKGNRNAARACRERINFARQVINHYLSDAYRSGESLLTKKQLVVLNLLREGLSAAQIARALGVSRAAVSKTVQRIWRRTEGAALVDILGARPNPSRSGVIYSQPVGKPRRVPRPRKSNRKG